MCIQRLGEICSLKELSCERIPLSDESDQIPIDESARPSVMSTFSICTVSRSQFRSTKGALGSTTPNSSVRKRKTTTQAFFFFGPEYVMDEEYSCMCECDR